MKWFMFKLKVRSIFLGSHLDYYCYDCCDPSHHAPLTLSFICGYIGVAVGLADVNKEAMEENYVSSK